MERDIKAKLVLGVVEKTDAVDCKEVSGGGCRRRRLGIQTSADAVAGDPKMKGDVV